MDRGLGRGARAGLAACLLLTLPACRSELERRARHIAGLRERAVSGIAAADHFCAERARVLEHFQQDEPGWERALEETLRAPDALNDYCEDTHDSHDHDGEGRPGGTDPESNATHDRSSPGGTDRSRSLDSNL